MTSSETRGIRIWNHFLTIDCMETKEITQQVKLGLFVLVGTALFLTSVFLIGSENNIFSRTFEVSAVFRNVEGLKEGDNVWLSGVKIGTVTNVRILGQGRVIVRLSLKNNQHQFVTEDATASVGSDGLVGNKILVIRPGTSRIPLAENDTLNTLSPTDTQELIEIAKDVGENTRTLTESLKDLADKINRGEGIVGEFLGDGQIAYDIRTAVTGIRQTSENSALATRELNALLTDLRSGSGLLPTLLHDTAYAGSFTRALQNIREVSANASRVSHGLAALSGRMDDDNNALGVLLNDSAFAERLRSTMTNAEQATQKLNQNMEALQHNFLLRGYFRKQDRKREREAASPKGNVNGK